MYCIEILSTPQKRDRRAQHGKGSALILSFIAGVDLLSSAPVSEASDSASHPLILVRPVPVIARVIH